MSCQKFEREKHDETRGCQGHDVEPDHDRRALRTSAQVLARLKTLSRNFMPLQFRKCNQMFPGQACMLRHIIASTTCNADRSSWSKDDLNPESWDLQSDAYRLSLHLLVSVLQTSLRTFLSVIRSYIEAQPGLAARPIPVCGGQLQALSYTIRLMPAAFIGARLASETAHLMSERLGSPGRSPPLILLCSI